MTRFSSPFPQRLLVTMALCAAALAASPRVVAAPGAHGPNGEHLDSPATARLSAGLPRVEAKSEAFELVAELRAGELAILVDRFESNEPVLGAKLEVESGTHQAVAAFRAEQGDYAVTDAALLKALAAPGEHGLVFTIVAATENDLLDGTLVTGPTGNASPDHDHAHGDDDHGHSHGLGLRRAAWLGIGILALGLVGGVGWWWQHRRDAGKTWGGL